MPLRCRLLGHHHRAPYQQRIVNVDGHKLVTELSCKRRRCGALLECIVQPCTPDGAKVGRPLSTWVVPRGGTT